MIAYEVKKMNDVRKKVLMLFFVMVLVFASFLLLKGGVITGAASSTACSELSHKYFYKFDCRYYSNNLLHTCDDRKKLLLPKLMVVYS